MMKTLEEYITKYGEKDGLRRWKACERAKRWYQEHREEQLEYKKRWYQEIREELAEYYKQRYQTPYGRARHLITAYRRYDRRHNRGECTLTVKWIVDRIFNRSCLYCGESDWRKLGCDRIDNAKAHTPRNVVCCCGKCNKKRQKMDFLKFAYSIGAKDSNGLIIK